MANTTAVYARIDTGLKNSAEEILAKLGITPSSAIQMLYSQIVLRGGMPFELRLPVKTSGACLEMNLMQNWLKGSSRLIEAKF